jgi:hypothetical protein
VPLGAAAGGVVVVAAMGPFLNNMLLNVVLARLAADWSFSLRAVDKSGTDERCWKLILTVSSQPTPVGAHRGRGKEMPAKVGQPDVGKPLCVRGLQLERQKGKESVTPE